MGIGLGVKVGLMAAVAMMAATAAWAQADLARSAEYAKVQTRLARGWNTWDVHSVATQVLLPEGLAIHVGMKHNSTLNGDAFLGDALIGRFGADAEVVTPGAHAWDGSYTSADFAWKGHKWRVESAHDGDDLVMLVTPLEAKGASALPPTVVFSVNFLWNRPGIAGSERADKVSAALGDAVPVEFFCTCAVSEEARDEKSISVPLGGPYFAAILTGPVGVSTGSGEHCKRSRGLLSAGARLIRLRLWLLAPKARLWTRSKPPWGGTRFMSRRRGA